MSGWVGHAEDNAIVVAPAPAGRSLGGEIAIVHVERIDPLDPERVIGRVERLVARPGDEAGTPAVAAWP